MPAKTQQPGQRSGRTRRTGAPRPNPAAQQAQGAATKPCRVCHELIPAYAKKCPRPECGAVQNPLRQWVLDQITLPKVLGGAGAAVVSLFGGAATIDYARGKIWPPELHARAGLRGQTLTVRAWNAGAKDATLRNIEVEVKIAGDPFDPLLWKTTAISWVDPQDFEKDGQLLPKDGDQSEAKMVTGKSAEEFGDDEAATTVFYELGQQCTFHVTATFNKDPVRIPKEGECPCGTEPTCGP